MNFKYRYRTLKKAFFLMILPLILLISIIVFAFIQWGQFKNNRNDLLLKIDYQLQMQSILLADPLWNLNKSRTDTILELLIEDPDIIGLSIYDEDDILFSSAGLIENSTKNDLELLGFNWTENIEKKPNNLRDFLPVLGFRTIRTKLFFGTTVVHFFYEGEKRSIGTLYIVFSDENRNLNSHNQMISVLILLCFIFAIISVSINIAYQITVGKPLSILKKSVYKARKDQGTIEEENKLDDLNEVEVVNIIFNKLWDEQKLLEQDLLINKKRFENSIKGAPIPMVLTDSNQDILLFNDKFIEMFGYTLEDVSTGEQWWVQAYPDKQYRLQIQSRWEKAISKSLLNGESIDMIDGVLTIKDRSVRHIEFYMTLLEGFSVIAMIDVTERIVKEKERVLLIEQLDHKNRMDALGQLSGGVAHDFNNILSGIISAADLLKLPKRNLDEKGQKYVSMILQASSRASELVNKLLIFSRKEERSSDIVDLNFILNETVGILSRTIDKKNAISVMENAHKAYILGDHGSLENIFINLGINASNAMSDGGVIEFQTDNVIINQSYCDNSTFDIYPGEHCKITVSDTGSGIPSENLNKIFEPFFTTKEPGKGTGLGLSTVYGSVQDHHGEIQVTSRVGVGTSFNLLFPISDEPFVEKRENTILSGFGTILFVDDEEINRSLGKDILESLGYKILLAENGEESVELFKRRHFEIDIVIMDMIMPVMNGAEAFLKMKEIDENCQVIIASGYTKDESIKELMALGLAGFIGKPYSISKLSQLLNDILV